MHTYKDTDTYIYVPAYIPVLANIFGNPTCKVNLLQAEPAHKEAVRGIAFSPSDLKFATCSDDSTIKASTGQLFV
jgi:WD40 repeat protein